MFETVMGISECNDLVQSDYILGNNPVPLIFKAA
jgi:hypothetical protein